MVELLGRDEGGELTEPEARLLRLLTPIMKLTTAKQAVAVLSEALECFGGAGYVEDTGLPCLLRDAQVLPIWEGTTNVLSLDALRAIAKDRSLDLLAEEVRGLGAGIGDAELAGAAAAASRAVDHARAWLERAAAEDPLAVEAGARRFAMTLGRALELALLARHAAWALDAERDERSRAAALRLAHAGVDLVRDEPRALAEALARPGPGAAR